MKTFKIAIVGGRDFSDYPLLKNKMLEVIKKIKNVSTKIQIEIVSGGAKGADSLAEKFAEEFYLPIKIFPADWNKNGRAAGFIRNKEIWDYVDMGVAFWDGLSKGTRHSIDLSKQLNKKLIIVFYKI